MPPDLMAQLKFFLIDIGQILKLIVMVCAPVAILVAIGFWIFVRRRRQE